MSLSARAFPVNFIQGNFGPLSKHNELYSDTPEAGQSSLSEGLWSEEFRNGPVVEHRQDPISKSEYQQRLERGEEEEAEDGSEVSKPLKPRFWSDYNRVFYIPRSIQAVPDLPDWEASKDDWNYGRGVFERFNSENSLSEESLRQFVEESDNFQGFQMMFDNSSFGGFSTAFLEVIRDESPKIPVLAFPILSGADLSKINVEDLALRTTALQDAACLQTLNELATQSIPIQSPTSWNMEGWSEHIDIDKKNLYQSSAVLSSHVESATLPFRLKERQEDLSDLCHQLNWAQSTRFSHLSGVLPFVDSDDLGALVHDFSTTVEQGGAETKHIGQALSQRNVTRGLSVSQIFNIEGFFALSTALEPPYLTRTHAPAYPLLSSNTQIFVPLPSNSKFVSKAKTTPKSTPLLSSLTTTTTTGAALKAYASLAGACVRRRATAHDAAGLELDELKELEEALWTMRDGYAEMGNKEGEGRDGEGESLGEDEE
ncbi:tubulin domain-containing protein [Phellopilus nigrolimitatus]|nr:tubulin domain-containing protein [Phellopilus nigrolimitatus]